MEASEHSPCRGFPNAPGASFRRRVKCIDTTATLTTGAAVNTIDVDIDPIVFGVGVGMRF